MYSVPGGAVRVGRGEVHHLTIAETISGKVHHIEHSRPGREGPHHVLVFGSGSAW